jgi:hypothetical protein
MKSKKILADVIENPDRVDADLFVQKMNRINDILQKQMTLAQASQKQFANVHRKHALKYAVND